MLDAALADTNAYCGALPFPVDHPLAKLGVQVKNGLTCHSLMEENYYSKRLPAAARSWPELCVHCGSDDSVEQDAELSALHMVVRPQCAECRAKRVKPITGGKSKQCVAAPDARKRALAAAAAESEQRREQRLPAPARTKSYLVAKIVGKAKRGKVKKVYWKDEDTGAFCGKDECTWNQPSAFVEGAGELKPEDLLGAPIRIEEQSTTFIADIDSEKVQPHSVLTVTASDNCCCRWTAPTIMIS
jgi:hypothetical protein